MLNKQIIILNGSGTSGKGTFVKLLNKYINVLEYSIANKPKRVLKYAGVPISEKTEEVRKAMSDMKVFLEQWDIPYKDVESIVNDFYNCNDYLDYKILSIDMREKHDIERAVSDYNAIKVLVVNKRVKQITSNIADAGVYDIEYDYVVHNDGSLEDLDNEAKKFLKWFYAKKCDEKLCLECTNCPHKDINDFDVLSCKLFHNNSIAL